MIRKDSEPKLRSTFAQPSRLNRERLSYAIKPNRDYTTRLSNSIHKVNNFFARDENQSQKGFNASVYCLKSKYLVGDSNFRKFRKSLRESRIIDNSISDKEKYGKSLLKKDRTID